MVCPDENQILPCVCSKGIEENSVTLECPPDTNEEQLQQVFEADFPSKNLYQFKMEGNSYVGVLRSGVFNNVSFQDISITLGGMYGVESGALVSSKDTLTKMQLYLNNIQSFPFEDLKTFTKLEFFSIGYNPTNLIPLDTFKGNPVLQTIHLPNTVSEFDLSMFHDLPQLTIINLAENSLSYIPSGFMTFGSTHTEKIYLNHNNIEEVSPGAFEAVEGLVIYLYNNKLTVLPEVTWRPMVEEGVHLILHNNPLLCGCDIAWLVRNTSLIEHISYGATCSDGQNIHDLNPEDYDLCY
ncbi:unnamed protein product [Meganyctiphanes norvegica]|uniref:Oplophorus-luciferin 2-monooxygenase non-catalytic subunit n=1 Tax=Meganyctiphanes norvegica TaxID=48144 RepID=A0AAV2Q776_MEGNR